MGEEDDVVSPVVRRQSCLVGFYGIGEGGSYGVWISKNGGNLLWSDDDGWLRR